MPLVNVEKQGHILKIGLNRPEKMNAMNRAIYHEIAALKSSKIAVSEGQEAAKQSLFPDLRPVMASEDVKEGIQSFLERREAVFKGK